MEALIAATDALLRRARRRADTAKDARALLDAAAAALARAPPADGGQTDNHQTAGVRAYNAIRGVACATPETEAAVRLAGCALMLHGPKPLTTMRCLYRASTLLANSAKAAALTAARRLWAEAGGAAGAQALLGAGGPLDDCLDTAFHVHAAAPASPADMRVAVALLPFVPQRRQGLAARLRALGEAELRGQRAEEAAAWLRLALQVHEGARGDDASDALRLLALACIDLGRLAEAANCLTAADADKWPLGRVALLRLRRAEGKPTADDFERWFLDVDDVEVDVAIQACRAVADPDDDPLGPLRALLRRVDPAAAQTVRLEMLRVAAALDGELPSDALDELSSAELAPAQLDALLRVLWAQAGEAYHGGRAADCQRWLWRVAALPASAVVPPATLSRAMAAAALALGDVAEARACAEQALALRRDGAAELLVARVRLSSTSSEDDGPVLPGPGPHDPAVQQAAAALALESGRAEAAAALLRALEGNPAAEAGVRLAALRTRLSSASAEPEDIERGLALATGHDQERRWLVCAAWNAGLERGAAGDTAGLAAFFALIADDSDDARLVLAAARVEGGDWAGGLAAAEGLPGAEAAALRFRAQCGLGRAAKAEGELGVGGSPAALLEMAAVAHEAGLLPLARTALQRRLQALVSAGGSDGVAVTLRHMLDLADGKDEAFAVGEQAEQLLCSSGTGGAAGPSDEGEYVVLRLWADACQLATAGDAKRAARNLRLCERLCAAYGFAEDGAEVSECLAGLCD